MCGLNAVGAQSGWKCAGMPPPLSHAYLVGFSATGAPDGLGRGDLEPHRDLVSRATQLITGGPGGGYSPSGRAQPRADSRSARARAPCGTRGPRGGSICPRKPPARAHGAAGRGLVPPSILLFTKFRRKKTDLWNLNSELKKLPHETLFLTQIKYNLAQSKPIQVRESPNNRGQGSYFDWLNFFFWA